MGTRVTVKQNDFSNGMQGDIRNKNLTSQTQVLGASKIKNFDIYTKTELSPLPSLARYNTDTERAFEIGCVSNEFETLFGLGKAMSNWYGIKWGYRVQLTDLTSSSAVDFALFDLSEMPATFWTNVKSDGSDIRVTNTTDKDSIKRNLIDFNSVANTGWVIVKKTSLENFYIYYGNADATEPIVTPDFSPKRLYLFDNSNGFDSGIFGGTSGAFSLEGTITPVTSIIGLGTQSNNSTDSGGATCLTGERTVSLLFRKTQNPVVQNTLVNHERSSISLKTDGKLQVKADSDDTAAYFLDSVTALDNDTWYHIAYTYDSSDSTLKIYINGVLDNTFSAGTINNDIESTVSTLTVSGTANNFIDMVSEIEEPKTASRLLVESNQMLNSTAVYTYESEVAFTSITPIYSGSQVYTKELAGSWEEVESNGILIQSEFDPLYTFVQKEANIYSFLTKEDVLGLITVRGTKFNAFTSVTETVLGTLQATADNPIATYGVDKRTFISVEDELDSFDGTTYVDGVFLSGGKIASTTNYGYNLAIAGNLKTERGIIEIWDLLNDDPTTVIDTGTGKQKIIANIKGGLYTVTDNYISNTYKSYTKPSIEIKKWTGRDNFNTIQSFRYPNYDPTFTDVRNDIVNNNRTDLNNYSLFYAEPSAIDSGMWGIGINEITGQLGVSIRFDTLSIGRITQHNAIGNNIVLITDDFEHWFINISDSYSELSTYESLIIDAGLPEIQKHFNKFEIVLDKPLPSGQTISAYYRKENEDTYTKIFDLTETGTKTWDANQNNDGTAFDSFNEIQIKLESSGGDASIVEWSLEVEYEEEE